MYYGLKQNSFFRQYGSIGYIEDQRTGEYLFLNETGAVFLSSIMRVPRSIESIIDDILPKYLNTSRETLDRESRRYFDVLVDEGFLCAGNSLEEAQAGSGDALAPLPYERFSNNLRDWIHFTGHQLKWAQVDLTLGCNENCIHCYIPSDDRKTKTGLPSDKIKTLIDEMSSMGVLGVSFSGGEVFLCRDIFDILAYCRARDLEVSLLSNLSCFPSERLDELKRLSLKEVQVSIYSMNPGTHDAITRRRGSLEATIRAIKELTECGIPVSVSCPIMKQNRDDYLSIYDFTRSVGCRLSYSYALIGKTDLSEANLACRLTEVELSNVILSILDKDPKLLLGGNGTRNGQLDLPICGAGINSCQIAPDGEVHICSGYTRQSCGNINTKPLHDIWEGSPLLLTLRNQSWGKMSPKCTLCKSRLYCYPCYARNGNEEECDIFQMCSYTCRAAESIHDAIQHSDTQKRIL